MDKITETAEKIREFNRYYLPYFHLLTQKYLDMDYSVSEGRILYELYDKKEICATDIVSALHVDKGYLSRILKRFESREIIVKKASETDGRRTLLSLTEKGKALAEKMIAESNAEIGKGVIGLSEEDMDELADHMKSIVRILEKTQNKTDV